MGSNPTLTLTPTPILTPTLTLALTLGSSSCQLLTTYYLLLTTHYLLLTPRLIELPAAADPATALLCLLPAL